MKIYLIISSVIQVLFGGYFIANANKIVQTTMKIASVGYSPEVLWRRNNSIVANTNYSKYNYIFMC